MMRAELHRELGEFIAAAELLTDWDSGDEDASAIREAAQQKVAAPLPITYAWQRKVRTE